MRVGAPRRRLYRYFEPLGVDDLARAAGFSRAHFIREFRRSFSESPHVYLLTRRMERVAGAASDYRSAAASISSKHPRSGPTASTRRFVTRPATLSD